MNKQIQHKIDMKVKEFQSYYRKHIENKTLDDKTSKEFEEKKIEHHRFIEEMNKLR